MTPLTIAYVVNAKVPEEVRAQKICASLAALGHNVILACKWSGEIEEREHMDGYQILRIGKDRIMATCFPGNPTWTSALSNIIEEMQLDIIICREMIPMMSCLRARKHTSIPIILDMAEHYPAAMREWKKYNNHGLTGLLIHHTALPDLIESHAIQHADAIITVCEEQENRLIEQFSYAKDALFLAHNTPDLNSFSTVKKGSLHPPIMFGHHGYFTLERNLEMLVEGFDLAAKRFPYIKLMLSGIGETFEDVVQCAQQCEAKDRILFTGAYKAHDLIHLYSQTDIGIMPYAEQEFRQYTLPNKAFDYMACGKPIISSALKPMKRLLDESHAGIYGDCSNSQHIAELINRMMQTNTEEMSKNGQYYHQKKYHWEHDSQHIQAAISYVLESNFS